MEDKRVDKKFVRYDEGAELYGICQKSFEKLATDAKAKYKYGKIVMVNTVLVDKFLETCRIVE